MKLLKKLLAPLIWIKDLQGNISEYLTKKAVKKTGADKPNKFKDWKFKQPIWKQFLLGVAMFLVFIYILYLITGYILIPLG